MVDFENLGQTVSSSHSSVFSFISLLIHQSKTSCHYAPSHRTTPSSPSSRPALGSGDNNSPVRWGIISAGRISSDYVKAFTATKGATVSFKFISLSAFQDYCDKFCQLVPYEPIPYHGFDSF
jgi:hypothetical protein